MTFETAFKHLYAEELAPYGFRKIKGKQPYFVRMSGEEIAHVISYRNEWTFRPYRDFSIRWGVATVYRKKIDLEQTPREAAGSWMTYVRDEAGRPNFEYRDESLPKPWFSNPNCEQRDVDMMEELERSASVVKQILLPQLDQINTLKACWEYLAHYKGANFPIYDNLEDGFDSEEGLLNFKVFNLAEFEEWRRTMSVSDCEEPLRTMRIQWAEEQILIFRKYTQDETHHQILLEEMERRKVTNHALLRGYGIEF